MTTPASANDRRQRGVSQNTQHGTKSTGAHLHHCEQVGNAPEIFNDTREVWCERTIAALIPRLEGIGIVHPAPHERDVRVAVVPTRRHHLGVCHVSRFSIDRRTNLITVGTQQAEPIELVHTLAHELLHAYDDCQSGHRGRWKRWADALGITAKGHQRTGPASALFTRVLEVVGAPWRHVPSHSQLLSVNLKPPPPTAVECPVCGQRCQYSTALLAEIAIQCDDCCVRFCIGTPRLSKAVRG
jgi:hypothetical protein